MVPTWYWDDFQPAFQLYLQGEKPEAGGYLDQPIWFTDLMPIARAEWERQRNLDKRKS